MVIEGLKCPGCESEIYVNFLAGPRVVNVADLARRKREKGGTGVLVCENCGYEGDPLEFDPRSALPKVAQCYIADNGMVIAFDDDGSQVPKCQGFLLEVASELKIRCDENTEWYMGQSNWETAHFGWWWTSS